MRKPLRNLSLVLVVLVIMFSFVSAAEHLNNVLVIGNTAIDIDSFFASPRAAELLVNEIMEHQGVTSMDEIWYRSGGGDYINVATNQRVEGTAEGITDLIDFYYSAADVADYGGEEDYEYIAGELVLSLEETSLHIQPNEAVDITATVTTKTGTPVEGIEVGFFAGQQDGSDNSEQLSASWVKTDEKGRAVVTFESTSANNDCFIYIDMFIDEYTKSTVHLLVAQTVATIEGYVTDALTGKPLEGIEVTILSPVKDRYYGHLHTNEEGYYKALVPPLGDYFVSFESDNHPNLSMPANNITTANTTRRVDAKIVSYDDLVIVTGRVIDNRTGQPAVNAGVFYDDARTHNHWTETDENGVFSFYVPIGSRSISIVLATSRYPDATISIVVEKDDGPINLGDIRVR